MTPPRGFPSVPGPKTFPTTLPNSGVAIGIDTVRFQVLTGRALGL